MGREHRRGEESDALAAISRALAQAVRTMRWVAGRSPLSCTLALAAAPAGRRCCCRLPNMHQWHMPTQWLHCMHCAPPPQAAAAPPAATPPAAAAPERTEAKKDRKTKKDTSDKKKKRKHEAAAAVAMAADAVERDEPMMQPPEPASGMELALQR